MMKSSLRLMRNLPRTIAQRSFRHKTNLMADVVEESNNQWPRKVFSGIQPTGTLHLGNYLGAVKKWEQMQTSDDNATFCIVDLHSITLPQDPVKLHANIIEMAATMLACGIDFHKSTVFVQSAVKEHAELGWILGTFSTMARLGHLPQFKEKSRLIRDVPLGIFIYPVLQAADIMLHKATHVPVGEDQVQHIQLAQHLAKVFNNRYGPTFPICHAIIDKQVAGRIKSLRDPMKKMSKSDPDPKATISLTDPPEVIVEKIKKGVTDFISDVKYEPVTRPGVSNLIAIHSMVTGKTIKEIEYEASTIDTGKYKLLVADAVVQHLTPIRVKIDYHLRHRGELICLLEQGAQKASEATRETIEEVKRKMGLGARAVPPLPITDVSETPPESIIDMAGSRKTKTAAPSAVELHVKSNLKPSDLPAEVPVVPIQPKRIEKKRNMAKNSFDGGIKPFVMDFMPLRVSKPKEQQATEEVTKREIPLAKFLNTRISFAGSKSSNDIDAVPSSEAKDTVTTQDISEEVKTPKFT